MATSTEEQNVVEQYCRTCGHLKEFHNLNFQGSPKEAHKLYGQGDYVCHDMTGVHSDYHCICVAWSDPF
jgi:hypothetical protein